MEKKRAGSFAGNRPLTHFLTWERMGDLIRLYLNRRPEKRPGRVTNRAEGVFDTRRNYAPIWREEKGRF